MNSAATIAFDLPTSLGLRHPTWSQIRHVGYTTENTPEEELSIQVTYINRIHINYMYILEPRQGKVREDLASQATGSDNQDLGLIAKKRLNL